jgi:general bacterial porin, GBP family
MNLRMLAGWGLGIAVTAAHAQSSVTLYGRMDDGIFYTTNQGGYHAFQFIDSSTQGTKWGLKGTEVLGGGWSAIFNLGSIFSVANGTTWPSGRIFGDYAYVGLSDNKIGTVKLGRQEDAMIEYLGPFTAGGSWGGAFFAHPYDNDNIWNTFIVNNVVRYQSANYAGLEFGGLYAFSNKASATSGTGGGFADNRLWAAGARYQSGPFRIAAVYEQLDNPGDDAPGTYGAVDVADANFTAASQRIYGVGVGYALRAVELHAAFTRTTLSEPTSEWESPNFTGASSMSFNNYEVNAVYHMTPQIDLKGAYVYTEAKVSGSAPHWNEGGLIANYAFSRRTSVYLEGVYQRVSGGGSQFAQADINDLPQASGDSQAVIGLGMKHTF